MSTQQSPERSHKHRLTRLGFHFLFVGAFAMLGGAVRGFNLLLVLAGLLVGGLLIQWRWSRRSIEVLAVQRRNPTEAFAETPFRVRYLLRNHGWLMPAWMVRIEDKIERDDGSQRVAAVCGAGVIAARKTVAPHVECTIARRGRYRFGPVSVVTTFPFSLLTSRQTTQDEEMLDVFPKLLTLRKQWQRRLVSRAGGVSTTARRSGSVEGDFFGLREWQAGDSPKWIHWRTTARLNEPAVRQFEQKRRFDACVLVDAFDTGDNPDPAELAISLAATFLVHLVSSPSNRLILAIAGQESEAVIGGGSVEGRRRMMRILSGIRTSEQPKLDEAAKKAFEIAGTSKDLIVISPRSADEVESAAPVFFTMLDAWRRRSSFRWINVSTEADQWRIPDREEESHTRVDRVTGTAQMQEIEPTAETLPGSVSAPEEIEPDVVR